MTPDRAALEELQQVLNEVFRHHDHVMRRDVYSVASAHLRLSSDMLTLLNEMPEGSYTRREMVEAINKAIEGRGEHEMLLEMPTRVRAVEETAEAERAVEDEAPLEALNPPNLGTAGEMPEFREPGGSSASR